MKLNFTANKRGNQSTFRAVIDFFFPYTKRIRFEAGTTLEVNKDGTRKLSREFGTFRAFFWHYFYAVRNAVFNLPPFPSFPPFLAPELRRSFGAIAFDANGTTFPPRKANATPWTFTHTSTGSNLVMAMGVSWFSNSGAITITTPTYNSVSLTSTIAGSSNNYRSNHYYLANPTTGANTASVSFSAGSYGSFGANTYSGADTANPKDAAVANSNTGTSISTNITTNNANSFLHDVYASNGGLGGGGQGAGQTVNYDEGAGSTGFSSRKATTTAGSQTMSLSGLTSGANDHIIMAINELAAVTFVPKVIIF